MDLKKNKLLIPIVLALSVTVVCALFVYVVNAETSTEFSVIVNYADGTSKLYEKGFMQMMGFPLSLTDLSGNQIASFTFALKMTPTYSGTLKNYTYSTSVRIVIGLYAVGTVAILPTTSISNSGTSLPSGSTTTIWTQTFTAEQVQAAWTYGWDTTKTYQLMSIMMSELAVDLTFTDNSVLSRTAPTTSMSLNFKYVSESTFTGLSVSWS